MNDHIQCNRCSPSYMAEPVMSGRSVSCKKCGTKIEIASNKNSENKKNLEMSKELKAMREELNNCKHEIEHIHAELHTTESEDQKQAPAKGDG